MTKPRVTGRIVDIANATTDTAFGEELIAAMQEVADHIAGKRQDLVTHRVEIEPTDVKSARRSRPCGPGSKGSASLPALPARCSK